MPLLKINMKLDADELDAGCSMIQGEVSGIFLHMQCWACASPSPISQNQFSMDKFL